MGLSSAELVAVYVQKAAAGVDYSPRYGAICPCCGNRAKIMRTMPWEDNTRLRYHRCGNTRCLICATGQTIKSIEVDMVVTNG